MEEYTIKQLCEHYNISRVTLERYRKNKNMPFFKRGRNVYFIVADIEKWFSEYNKIEKYNYKEETPAE